MAGAIYDYLFRHNQLVCSQLFGVEQNRYREREFADQERGGGNHLRLARTSTSWSNAHLCCGAIPSEVGVFLLLS